MLETGRSRCCDHRNCRLDSDRCSFPEHVKKGGIMGRNVNGLELTYDQRAKLAYEWLISDLMEEEETRLRGLLKSGAISPDEFYDRMSNLRENAEAEYEFSYAPQPEESFGIEPSDWDDFEDYMGAF